MSDANAAAAPPVPTTDSLRGAALIGYGLFLAAHFTAGLTAVAAVILAYIKQSEAHGTIWASHFRNQIVVFWVMAITFMLAVPIYVMSIAVAVLFGIIAWPVSLLAAPFILVVFLVPFGLIVVVWFFYRVIKGLVRASDSKAYD